MGSANALIFIINKSFDSIFFIAGLCTFLGFPLSWFFKKSTKTTDWGNLTFQTLFLYLSALICVLIWISPELTSYFSSKSISWNVITALGSIFRLSILALVSLVILYIWGHENGQKRWLSSAFSQITIVFLGFLLCGWLGILFISGPLLIIYYCLLFQLALAILPASHPEAKDERWKRFLIFASYAWGLQFPLMVATKHAWKAPETRISGDFTWSYPISIPGLVWTPAHQVVAISTGMQFKRVDGPGLVFTGQMERPDQVFDLRLQLRSNEIEVVSQDGIRFFAYIFTAFRLDPEPWSTETYDQLRRMNPVLRGANRPDYTEGSFPYSKLRVQAALGATSSNLKENTTIYWDQWALKMVEDQARKILSQKKLNELWRLDNNNNRFANAMDEIAREIRENTELILRAKGIFLVVARVVNFRFQSQEQMDDISKQQLATWGSELEEQRLKILSEGEADAELAQQEARAYAQALLLNSMAEALASARQQDGKLPPYIVAMRYLSSLQEYIHKQPDGNNLTEQHHYLQDWQSQIHPQDKGDHRGNS
jgi:hypothetical protein